MWTIESMHDVLRSRTGCAKSHGGHGLHGQILSSRMAWSLVAADHSRERSVGVRGLQIIFMFLGDSRSVAINL